MAPKKNTPAPSNPANKRFDPATENRVGKVKRWASDWQGVFAVAASLVAILTAFVFVANFYVKLNVLESDEKRNSDDISGLAQRVDKANDRIDQLMGRLLRLDSPLGKSIPTPDVARAMSPSELKARFQLASSIVTTDIDKQTPQNPEVVKQVRNDLDATLRQVALPPDVHQAGEVALAHVQGYFVFSLRATMPGIRGVVYLPEGKMILAGPELQIGAIWNAGRGQDKTTFIIAPTQPPPSLFYIDAPSILSDLSILTLGAHLDLEALTLRGDSATALVYRVTIEGLNQNLARIVWLGVTLRDCVVRYSGGPLYLADVRFEDCKLEFGSDPMSQRVLHEIQSRNGQPVSLVVLPPQKQ